MWGRQLVCPSEPLSIRRNKIDGQTVKTRQSLFVVIPIKTVMKARAVGLFPDTKKIMRS